MEFRLEDIPAAGREESFSEDESPLNDRLGKETTRQGVQFTGPIRVRVRLSRSGRMVLVHSQIEARVVCVCARCLELFAMNLSSSYQTSLKPKPEAPFPEEIELSREDLETDYYKGETIDLTPLVQDQALLTLPPKTLCREECRGLCPQCGKNLNQESCTCAERKVDPRLAPLKNFRVH